MTRYLGAFRQFSAYVRDEFGVSDTAAFEPVHLNDFAIHISLSHTSSHAQTTISACNSVMSTLTYGRWIPLSPSQSTGSRRDTVRSLPHLYIAPKQVIEKLSDNLTARTLAVIGLACHFGLRLEEAVCLDLEAALKEFKKSGTVDVIYGTKGNRGREVQRLVPVTKAGHYWVEHCRHLIGPRYSLIPEGMTRDQLKALVEREAQPILQESFGLTIHGLRHEYAARRYRKITGHYTPVNCCAYGHPLADKGADKRAREIITRELGHGRTQVVATYIGSYPRRIENDTTHQ